MDKKNILTQIKELFNKQEETLYFKDYKTQDGRIIRTTVDALTIGDTVSEITADGETALMDGDYVLEDGTIVEVVAGKIGEIASGEEETNEGETEDMKKPEMMGEEAFVDTTLLDGTKVKVEGDLAVGNKVSIEKDGAYVQAPEGQHNLSDGRVIYVDKDGLINEIQTPDTKKQDTQMEEVFSSLELLVNKIQELTEKVDSLQSENTELKSKVETFAKAPQTEGVEKSVRLNKNNKEELLKFFANR